MEKNEEMLQKGSFLQLACNLCVPTIVIMLVMVIYNMADTYFIGKTGDPCKIRGGIFMRPRIQYFIRAGHASWKRRVYGSFAGIGKKRI